MIAPVWMGAPPEVHSALLSAGPGAGPMLAAADAWRSLSVEYAEVAAELTEVLNAVEAGAWDGPSAEAYLAANLPYLAWLIRAGTDSAITAAQHETAATAYGTALAAMPTLAELAANHASHAVLLATNFFGINTIPIALNEADYVRMWVQAATVMTGYQAVSTAAAASAAAANPGPAPRVVKANSAAAQPAAAPAQPPAWFVELGKFLQGLVPHPAYPNTSDFPLYAELNTFFDKIGFTGVWDPFSHFFAGLNGSSLLPPPGVPGSWLAFTGNPLSYLNPASIAYVLSVPLEPGSYAAFTSIVIVDDMLAIAYTALFNPQGLFLVVPLATVEMVGSTIGNTVQLLHYLLTQTLLPAVLPLLASPALLAPSGLLGGLGGLAALASLAPTAVPIPPGAVPPPFGGALATPPSSVPTGVPAPAQVPTVPAPPATPPPAAQPPTPAGPPSATMDAFLYLVGDLGSGARRSAGTDTSTRQAPQPDETKAPPAEVAAEEPIRRRRRRVKDQMLGRGYEYMDLEDEPAASSPTEAPAAGPHGLTGTAPRAATARPAGLTALAGGTFDGSGSIPMMPSSWGAEPD